MGCVQARPYSPHRHLEKMKIENGYAPAGSYNRPVKDRISLKEAGRRIRHKQSNSTTGGGDGAVVEDGRSGGKILTREEEKGGGGISQRMNSSKTRGGGYEMVDGWPKWLTDNVPKDALIGLVPKSAESYDKLDKIGQGTYSNVYKARDRDTGKIVALKKVRFDTSESESVKFMAREIMILQKLDHPNVVKLEGLATSRMQYSLYLVFDFMQSDLARIISRPDVKLTEPQVKCYMQQLLSGLQHCHERGILHRDIKGSNLLIDKNGMLKIADFGLANYFYPNQRRRLTSRVVTLWYRAPELLLGATDYGAGIDLWSAGCLLAEMFAGRPIMPGRTEVEQLHKIFKLCGTPSEDYWKKVKLSANFRPLQTYKPSIIETFRDFPTSSWSLLTTLLALDPAYRGSAASALQNEFFSTSPLACTLSGLPVTYKEDEDESISLYERRRTSKQKRRMRAQHERQGKKDVAVENPKGDSSSKEEREKSPSTSSHSSSTASTSSGLKPHIPKGSSPPSLSPVKPFNVNRSSPRTECHPWAGRNIQNLPSLLPTPKIKNVGDYPLVGRSASMLDIQQLDKGRRPAFDALDD